MTRIPANLALLAAVFSAASGSHAFARDFVGNMVKDWSVDLMSDTSGVDSEFAREVMSLRTNRLQMQRLGYGVGSAISRPPQVSQKSSGKKSAPSRPIYGSATVVLVDQEPMILTSSHVLAGRDTAVVSLGRSHLKFNATRVQELDHPAADLVLLRPEIPRQGPNSRYWLVLEAIGVSNVRFCSPNEKGCSQGFQWGSKLGSGFGDSWMCAAPDGQVDCVWMTNWGAPVLARDEVVSGIYPSMLRIPVFARPGMSGGAVYHQGVFHGMIGKVDMGPSSLAYAIPVAEIAKVVAQSYFKVPMGLAIPKAEWVGNAGDFSIQMQLSTGERLTSSPRAGKSVVAGGEPGSSGGEPGSSGGEPGSSGGEPGSSGGEPGSSGGEPGSSGGEPGSSGGGASSKYWRLQVAGTSMTGKPVWIANPFLTRTHAFEIDGRRVSYLRVERKGVKRGQSPVEFASPTLARYLSLRRPLSRKEKTDVRSWQPVFADQGGEQDVYQRRQGRLRFPSVGYMYDRTATGFKQSNQNYDLSVDNGGQALYPKAENRKRAPELRDIYALTDALKSRAPQGYHGGIPYNAAKDLGGKLLDVLVYVPSRQGIMVQDRIVFGTDLERLTIQLAETRSTITLERASPLDAPTMIYCQKDAKSGRCKSDSPYRAAVIWRDEDLGAMDRVLVLTPKHMHEFVACVPGSEGDCVR